MAKATPQDWRDLGDEFGRLSKQFGSRFRAVHHPPRLTLKESEQNYPPWIEPGQEYRWWTVDGGTAGAADAFMSVAQAAANALGYPSDIGWQGWLEFLCDATLGATSGGHGSAGRQIDEDLSTISQRACLLLATGTIAPPAIEATDSNRSYRDELTVLDPLVDRHNLVTEFLARVFMEKGKRILRKDLYLVSGYRDRTEFQRWQSRKSKPAYADGGGVDQIFRSTLRMSSDEFLKKSLRLKQEPTDT